MEGDGVGGVAAAQFKLVAILVEEVEEVGVVCSQPRLEVCGDVSVLVGVWLCLVGFCHDDEDALGGVAQHVMVVEVLQAALKVVVLVDTFVFLFLCSILDDEEVEFLVLGLLLDEDFLKLRERPLVPLRHPVRQAVLPPQDGAKQLAGHVDEGDGMTAVLPVVEVEAHGVVGGHGRAPGEGDICAVAGEQPLEDGHVLAPLARGVEVCLVCRRLLPGGCKHGADGAGLAGGGDAPQIHLGGGVGQLTDGVGIGQHVFRLGAEHVDERGVDAGGGELLCGEQPLVHAAFHGGGVHEVVVFGEECEQLLATEAVGHPLPDMQHGVGGLLQGFSECLRLGVPGGRGRGGLAPVHLHGGHLVDVALRGQLLVTAQPGGPELLPRLGVALLQPVGQEEQGPADGAEQQGVEGREGFLRTEAGHLSQQPVGLLPVEGDKAVGGRKGRLVVEALDRQAVHRCFPGRDGTPYLAGVSHEEGVEGGGAGGGLGRPCLCLSAHGGVGGWQQLQPQRVLHVVARDAVAVGGLSFRVAVEAGTGCPLLRLHGLVEGGGVGFDAFLSGCLVAVEHGPHLVDGLVEGAAHLVFLAIDAEEMCEWHEGGQAGEQGDGHGDALADDHLAEAAARGLEALHEDGEDDEQHGFDSRCRRRCHEPALPEVGEAHERHVAEEDDGDDGHHLTHGGDSLSVVETHFVFVI